MDTSPQNPRLGIILTVMTLSHTIASFCNLSIPSLTPFLRNELHLTHAQVGMLMSFFYIGVVSASIFFGWTTDLMGELVRKELVGQATGFSLTITFLGIIFFRLFSDTSSTDSGPTPGPGICWPFLGLWLYSF
jgi:fucose permease